MCSRSDVTPRCSPNESVSPTSLDLWERVHIWFSKMDKYSAQPEQLPNEPEPCGSWHSKLTLQKSLVVADTHPSKQMCFQRFNLKQQSKRSGETSGISMRSTDQRRVFFKTLVSLNIPIKYGPEHVTVPFFRSWNAHWPTVQEMNSQLNHQIFVDEVPFTR